MTKEFEQVEITSPEALHAWLTAHHAQEESVWLVTWKKASPGKYVSREAVLDALIAFGWIDGRRARRDDDRTMQLISPRRTQAWAESYKARAARLEAEGRMEAPGRASIAVGKASGLWDAMADVDALIVPDDLAAALKTEPGAEAHFTAAAPSYRRNILRWIKRAKGEATRAKRIATIVAQSARGEKVPQM
ncbi:MAG: YdeI/OmpD-associated family protein [Pseudomonadota bacterium]